MNAINFIQHVLHQENYMEQQEFTKWQKMTVLKTFLYDHLFQTLVQHRVIITP